jgi:hypothetical protein
MVTRRCRLVKWAVFLFESRLGIEQTFYLYYNDIVDRNAVMPIPLDHVKERLSNAYVSAVAAQAGATFTPKHPEYGDDAFITPVKLLDNGRYAPLGYVLICQLKSTTTSKLEDNDVVYDMDVVAYNKLAGWEGTSPCILVLFRLPKNPRDWLTLDEEQLRLKNCCYWKHITGPLSTNESWQRIRIPRTQTFTPEAVIELLEKIRQGEI